MERYQVILAYDGTHFSGFQRQARSRTVQEVVEAALRRLGWQGKSLLTAGRTDAGVHASGQVIAFDLAWEHSPEKLQGALNSLLPFDVAAREVKVVPPKHHPRYDAVSRRYHYSLYCEILRDPLRDRYAWQVWPPVELSTLRHAAAYFLGRHDFAAFGTPPRPQGTTMRTVFEADWHAEGSNLVFVITADAFLYHMVRRIVHLQVAIGQGKQGMEMIPESLQPRAGTSLVKGLAPAHGLVLVEVLYPAEAIGERPKG